MADIIQLRRDTAANWASANPVLAQGETGLDLDTNNLKWGDGSTAWNSLNYAIPSPTIAVPVRNTVISGPTSWLAAGTGLQVISQNGAAIATIADGFNTANGEDNRVFEIPNATEWNSLAANSTVYHWVEHDGTLTTGSGTLAPAYGPTAPASPSSGQWWFNTIAYQGFSWNGSAWVAAPRLYVGQATTDGSGVTAVVQYAYLGRATVGSTMAASATASYNHNIGTRLLRVDGFWDDISGAVGLTNGTGGYPISGAHYPGAGSSNYGSDFELIERLSIGLRTGLLLWWRGNPISHYFTGATARVHIERSF